MTAWEVWCIVFGWPETYNDVLAGCYFGIGLSVLVVLAADDIFSA